MAKLNCISERALRLYQKKGILEPRYVNPETGFRYYDIEQCMKLDMLVQLQGLGLSLDEIAEVTSRHDLNYLRDKAREHLDSIESQLTALLEARAAAKTVIDSCDAFADPPILNQVLLEQLPERKIVRFKLANPEATRRVSDDRTDLKGAWELSLRDVKREMLDQGYPLAAFNNVGCIVPHENFSTPEKYVEYAFITLGGSFSAYGDRAETVPAGQYLTFYTEDGYDCEGNEFELGHLERMLDYAAAKHLNIVGDFYDDVLCRYQRLLSGDGTILCRHSLRVSKQAAPKS